MGNIPATPPPDGASIAPSLLLRARAHDPQAWRRLTYLCLPVVLNWARRAGLKAHDAEDVAQEVFRAVAMHLPSFRRDRAGDTFRGWLWTITRSKLQDHWRKREAQPCAAGGTDAQVRLAQTPVFDNSSFIEQCQESDESAVVRRGLELIRPEFEGRTWQAFWRVTVDGEPAAQAGAALGLSAGAVYVAKSRVLRRLGEELAGIADDAGVE